MFGNTGNEYWPSIEQSFGQWPYRPQTAYVFWSPNFPTDQNQGQSRFDDSCDQNNNHLSWKWDNNSENVIVDRLVCGMDFCNDEWIGINWRPTRELPPIGTPMSVPKSPQVYSSPMQMSQSRNDWSWNGEFGYEPTIGRTDYRTNDQSNDGTYSVLPALSETSTSSTESCIETISSRIANVSAPIPQARSRRRQPSLMECVFCKNNNERPEFYKSHILKDPDSNIQCPVLSAYNCPICNNGGGRRAHTMRYCPLNKAGIQAKIERFIRDQKMSNDEHLDHNYAKKFESKKSRKYRKREK